MTFFSAFAAGFFTAFLIVAVGMYGLYAYSRQKRKHHADIKGYLDLIPDLSQKQREKVQEIRRLFLPKVQVIRENLRRDRAELARLLFREPADRPVIQAVTMQIVDHQLALEREVIDHILEERELLTPPQKKKFYDIILEQFASGGLGVHDVRGKR